jgi:hypothetical protein
MVSTALISSLTVVLAFPIPHTKFWQVCNGIMGMDTVKMSVESRPGAPPEIKPHKNWFCQTLSGASTDLFPVEKSYKGGYYIIG